MGTMHDACDPWTTDCTSTVDAKANSKKDRAALYFAGHNNFVAAMNRTLFTAGEVNRRPTQLLA